MLNDEVIVIEDLVDQEGMRCVHLMSNLELNAESLQSYGPPFGTRLEIKKESGAYHLSAAWPMRGPLKMHCEGWPRPKIFVVWNLAGCESVKKALYEAAMQYEDLFKLKPEYAFIHTMPRGVQSGVGIGSLMLFEAEWMVRKCVAVGYLYG